MKRSVVVKVDVADEEEYAKLLLQIEALPGVAYWSATGIFGKPKHSPHNVSWYMKQAGHAPVVRREAVSNAVREGLG